MKRKISTTIFCLFVLVGSAWANQTRMDVFMAGDYIDDLVNIDIYPHQIVTYENKLYGDIKTDFEDYGITITPDRKYGAVGVWQNPQAYRGFNVGYAINFYKFSIGICGSPVQDHMRFGIGIGRTFFNRRFDISFHTSDDENWSKFNLRLAERKGDFVIMPKYTSEYINEPLNYSRHRIGLMLQRLILNEGFVYLIAEYDFSRGDIENDQTHIYAGLELPISKKLALLLGIKENFINGFDAPEWFIEPGLSIRIREFSFDFHLNKDRLWNKDVTILNAFGLELNFGRF